MPTQTVTQLEYNWSEPAFQILEKYRYTSPAAYDSIIKELTTAKLRYGHASQQYLNLYLATKGSVYTALMQQYGTIDKALSALTPKQVINALLLARENLSTPTNQQTSVLTTERPVLKTVVKLSVQPIPVPANAREGLVKVVNGKAYYDFGNYDPDLIELVVRNAMSNYTPTSIKYKDEGNVVTTKPVRLSLSLPAIISTLEQNEHNVNPEWGRTTYGSFVYKYPTNTVRLYLLDPSLAMKVKKQLRELHTNALSNTKKTYYWTNKPLTNLPNGELNDTLSFKFVVDPRTLKKVVVPTGANWASARISRGDYSLNFPIVLYWQQDGQGDIKVQDQENLYFVPNSHISYPKIIDKQNGQPLQNPDPRHVTRPSNPKTNELMWHGNPEDSILQQYGTKTYPYEETKKKILNQNSATPKTQSSIVQKAKTTIKNFLNVFRKSLGGTLIRTKNKIIELLFN